MEVTPITHLEKVIAGEISAVTHLEKVIAEETTAVTYTEKVIAGIAPPITHLEKVIAGVADPITHLEYVWAGRTPEPTEHEYTGAVPVTITADGTPLLDFLISGNMEQSGTPTPTTPIQLSECGDLETSGAKAGQYKIPIQSANTTTPVYLGEVQSTRQIKKLVLTGEEEWYDNWRPASGTYASMLPSQTRKVYYSPVLCTHIEFVSYQQIYEGTVGISIVPGNLYLIAIRVPDTVASNIAEFRAYLAAQYAAGTPVTVWYVLAEPTTGIINEPIRKIGDYADTLSMEQAGVSIPTLKGQTVVDVDTTLKPSEVYIKYKG